MSLHTHTHKHTITALFQIPVILEFPWSHEKDTVMYPDPVCAVQSCTQSSQEILVYSLTGKLLRTKLQVPTDTDLATQG